MRHLSTLGLIGALLGLLLLPGPQVRAGDLELVSELTLEEFEELADHLADAIEPPSGPARHLGVTGLDVQVGVVWVEADDKASWWQHSLAGYDRLLGAGLGGYRASVLKGLPRGIDVGGHIGSVAGEDFWTAEVRAALLRGSSLKPAFGVRACLSTLREGPVDLQVITVQAMISKGFTLITPYAAAGMRRVSADTSVQEPIPLRFELDRTTFVANAGVQLILPPIVLRAELRKGASTTAFLGAGIRF